MTKVIGHIELNSGLLAVPGEQDMRQSQIEIDRLNFAGVSSPSIQPEHVAQEAKDVMKEFEGLQRQIQELSTDYDKDEATLLAEVKHLEEKNRQSLKNQREVHKAA